MHMVAITHQPLKGQEPTPAGIHIGMLSFTDMSEVPQAEAQCWTTVVLCADCLPSHILTKFLHLLFSIIKIFKNRFALLYILPLLIFILSKYILQHNTHILSHKMIYLKRFPEFIIALNFIFRSIECLFSTLLFSFQSLESESEIVIIISLHPQCLLLHGTLFTMFLIISQIKIALCNNALF